MLGGRRLMSNYIVVNCELTSWRSPPPLESVASHVNVYDFDVVES